MKITHYFLVSFTLYAFTSMISYAEDLVSVYQLAHQNDPEFRAAQAEYLAKLELKNQSVGLFLPNITASAHYTDNENTTNPVSASPEYKYKTDGYSLTLTQPLYRHANFIDLKQANSQIALAHAIFENTRQNLILRVATQYFAVLAAEDDLAFAIKEREAIQEQLKQTQQRFKVGLIAITDVHEAKARYDQAVASAIVADNTLAINREILRETTATEHLQLAPLSTEHPLVQPQPSDITQWVKTAKTQNALLTASMKNVDIAQEEVSRQRSGHYPTLDLRANYTYTNFGEGAPLLDQRKQNDTTVSLQLNIPLYQGGIVNSRTRAAAYQLTQAREKLEQQQRATERQTRSAYLSVIANISQVKALKQALASSSIALKATQTGFEVGTRTSVDVLDSQSILFRARRDYAQVRYNYVLETLKLKFAAGTLSETDIKQLNPWLK